MTTYRAEEARRGLLTPPFFRFFIYSRKHSNQHALLRTLNRRCRHVYYAAPEFSKPRELHDAYQNRTVIDQSAFISPSDIGSLRDEEAHKVSFEAGDSTAYFLSDPVKIHKLSGRTLFLEKMPQDINHDQGQVLDEAFFKELARQLIDIYSSFVGETGNLDEYLSGPRGAREPWEFATFVCRSLFSCELYLAVQRPSQSQ